MNDDHSSRVSSALVFPTKAQISITHNSTTNISQCGLVPPALVIKLATAVTQGEWLCSCSCSYTVTLRLTRLRRSTTLCVCKNSTCWRTRRLLASARDCGLLGRNGFADGKICCCCCCRDGSLVVLRRRNELSGLCWDLSLRKLSEVCHVCCGGDGVVSCQLTMLAQKPLTIVFLTLLPTSLDRIWPRPVLGMFEKGFSVSAAGVRGTAAAVWSRGLSTILTGMTKVEFFLLVCIMPLSSLPTLWLWSHAHSCCFWVTLSSACCSSRRRRLRSPFVSLGCWLSTGAIAAGWRVC